MAKRSSFKTFMVSIDSNEFNNLLQDSVKTLLANKDQKLLEAQAEIKELIIFKAGKGAQVDRVSSTTQNKYYNREFKSCDLDRKATFYIYLKQNLLLLKLKLLTKKDDAQLILAREQEKLPIEGPNEDETELARVASKLRSTLLALAAHATDSTNFLQKEYGQWIVESQRTLKEFIANEGGCESPLEGSILDMTSSTEVRPVSGLVAADYFAPGYFVWAVLIAKLARVGFEEKNMYMAAYDWRLTLHNTNVDDEAKQNESFRCDECRSLDVNQASMYASADPDMFTSISVCNTMDMATTSGQYRFTNPQRFSTDYNHNATYTSADCVPASAHMTAMCANHTAFMGTMNTQQASTEYTFGLDSSIGFQELAYPHATMNALPGSTSASSLSINRVPSESPHKPFKRFK
ncbi:phospholipid:diacylglycerol acyltransferase 1-like protein [Tanacetum coccineum]